MRFNKSSLVMIMTIFLYTCTLHSQTEMLNETLKNYIRTPLLDFKNELYKEFQHEDKFKNNLTREIDKINFNTNIALIDSVLIQTENGILEKHIYVYDSRGEKISYLSEIRDANNLLISLRQTNTFNANGNLISQLYETWEKTIGGHSSIYTYKYNANNDLISKLLKEWKNNNWENYNKTTVSYDSDFKLTSRLFKHWSNNSWENRARELYTYNSKGEKISYSFELWSNDSWKFYYSKTYTYNSNSFIISKTYTYWNSNNEGDFVSRTLYKYNSFGNRILQEFETWEDGNWVNSQKDTSVFDSNGNVTFQLSQTWKDSNWVNLWKNNTLYNANGETTSILSQTWEGSNWVNSWKNSSEYDANGNITLQLEQDWGGSSWVNIRKNSFTYSSNGIKTSRLSEWWNDNKWEATNRYWEFQDYSGEDYYFVGSIIDVFYSAIADTSNGKITIPTYSLSQNYPNPFNPTTVIKYILPKQSVVQLDVYNVLGKRVSSLINKSQSAGYYEITFDASQLSSGVYFYRLTASSKGENFSSVKKMILLR